MTTTQPPELVNHEAERALLGAALLDDQVFTAFDVSPDDFSDARWRALWAAGQKLTQQGDPVESLTLPADVLNVVGGAPVIVELINGCESTVRAGAYAAIVKEKSEQRRWVQIASNLARAAHKDDGMRHELLARAIEDARGLLAEDGGTTGWTIYTLADAYSERKPLEYAVDGLFSLPSLSIVYGAPGCLKSMLVADMALCVAAGIPWLEPLPSGDVGTSKATVPVPVLWLDFDNGTRRTHERMEALARARDLDPQATAFYYAAMPTPWLDAGDNASIESLIQRVNIMSVGLIVIDNLGTVAGDADENSADMVRVLANLRCLAEETGAAVVVIHHQRKATGYNARAGESLRGHSSIEAALDLALLVQREEHADTVTIKSTKSRGVDVLPFGAVWTYDHKLGTTELARARFYGVRVETKASQTDSAILDAVAVSPGINKTSLVGEVREALADDIGLNYIRGRIDLLAENGQLATENGTHNAILYRVGAE